MNTGGWILIAAVTTALVYTWRYFAGGSQTEPTNVTSAQGFAKAWGLGSGNVVSPEGFLIAWGFTFLGISFIAAVYPPLGSAFAILLILGDLLVNASAVGSSATALEKEKTSNTKQKG